jgi:reverse transcriptase-like protein
MIFVDLFRYQYIICETVLNLHQLFFIASLKELIIDVDGSPLGFIAWYNYRTKNSLIRMIQPVAKNLRFGVQRVEMAAIYYGLRDNIVPLLKVNNSKRRKIYIDIRSDSKSTIEQLQGHSKIRDRKLQKITKSIMKMISRIKLKIVFNHVNRNKNIAGQILDIQRRERNTYLHYLLYFSINRQALIN